MAQNIYTPLPLVSSEEELAACLALVGRCGPRGGMVFLEDGQEFVRIPLDKNLSTIIDRSDYDDVGRFRWHAHKDALTWYARRGEFYECRNIEMHRQLLGFPGGQVDHRNGNGLDNRRSNLRHATCAQNQRNRTAKYRYKGIGRYGREKRWKAQIWVNNEHLVLGRFNTPEEAAYAYDLAAIEHFGEFAKLNFPFNA